MSTEAYLKEQFESLQSLNGAKGLADIRRDAVDRFNRLGIPTTRHEEWKYTRINSLFRNEFRLRHPEQGQLDKNVLEQFLLPVPEAAGRLVFVNGYYSRELSDMDTAGVDVLPLEEAATGKHKDVVARHFNHSSKYLDDGINALNTAFLSGGVFLDVPDKSDVERLICIYHITDARTENILATPRLLVHVGERAKVRFAETYATLGQTESFTNEVTELVVEKDAAVEFYKIQNDRRFASQVSTTHFRQVGRSHVHCVTVSLDGGIVRNNLNIVLEAEYAEAHLYGLYFQDGQSHIDNHTIVDNVKPNCFSNEFYKGVMNGASTGVFNGKIFVRQDAQKTNAYQSNKNVLLSDDASVNTKPQLEIYADDVKCSHGCTVGQLDETALFYLRSRGISELTAKSLLVHAFASDILEHIRPESIRNFVEQLINDRLATSGA